VSASVSALLGLLASTGAAAALAARINRSAPPLRAVALRERTHVPGPRSHAPRR